MANNENTKNQNEELLEEHSEVEESTENSQEDALAKCQEELNKQKDKLIRAHADFDNMQKRLEKEKNSAVIYANEAFARDLLSVIDTFENALVSMDKVEDGGKEAIEKIKEGVLLTYDQLVGILKKHGVEEIACEGEFDPNFHQVVTQMESEDHTAGEIVQVLQKGYKLKDRLLRASMVATCK